MKIAYREVEGTSARYWALADAMVLVALAGLIAAYAMEEHGHAITGMTNQIVWGMPHVFAVFLIVAASGALNVASIASVFGKPFYKPLARKFFVRATASRRQCMTRFAAAARFRWRRSGSDWRRTPAI